MVDQDQLTRRVVSCEQVDAQRVPFDHAVDGNLYLELVLDEDRRPRDLGVPGLIRVEDRQRSRRQLGSVLSADPQCVPRVGCVRRRVDQPFGALLHEQPVAVGQAHVNERADNAGFEVPRFERFEPHLVPERVQLWAHGERAERGARRAGVW